MPKRKPTKNSVSKPVVSQVEPRVATGLLLGIFSIIIVAVSMAVLWYLTHRSSTSSTPDSQASTRSTAVPSPVSSPSGSLTSLDETHNLYSNPTWGFSIKIPKEALGNACFKGGSGYYSIISSKLAPLVMLESVDGLYLTFANTPYLHGDNQCDTKPTTLASFSDSENDFSGLVSFVFRKQAIANEIELKSFIAKTFGSGCTYTSKPSSSAGVQDISLVGDGKSLVATACRNDTDLAIKYMTGRKQVIYWDMGQEAAFVASNDSGSPDYNREIEESFTSL